MDWVLLWGRLIAVAMIQPLAQGLPYAAGVALKGKKKKKEEEEEKEEIPELCLHDVKY